MPFDTTFHLLTSYSDEMNRRLLNAAMPLTATQLDEPFDIGMGNLRKTLQHILVGEQVWLERQLGNAETNWPPYESTARPTEMLAAFEQLWPARDTFIASLDESKFDAIQRYRDSKGTLFTSSLREMLIQGLNHSTHHRSQATHLIKRLSGKFVELDFMYYRRQESGV